MHTCIIKILQYSICCICTVHSLLGRVEQSVPPTKYCIFLQCTRNDLYILRNLLNVNVKISFHKTNCIHNLLFHHTELKIKKLPLILQEHDIHTHKKKSLQVPNKLTIFTFAFTIQIVRSMYGTKPKLSLIKLYIT